MESACNNEKTRNILDYADPASLLRIAGVDIPEDKTYEAAGEYISALIDEFIEMAGAI